MKIPKRVIQIAERIAKNAAEQRKLNCALTSELEKLGIDTGAPNLIASIAYLEGDCTTSELIKYLEEL